jgi:pyruvate dehydrogenase E1 component alpha subunit
MHSVDPEAGVYASTSIVGGSLPIALGAALAFSIQKRKHVAAAFMGDGATEEGTFHESCNLASLRNLPLIIVVEDNEFATLSPKKNRQSYPSSTAIAKVYGLECFEVDGNCAKEVSAVAGKAIGLARNGRPALIQASTYRWKAHVGTTEDTGMGYRTAELLKEWKTRCPILALTSDSKILESDILSLTTKLKAEIEEAFNLAKMAPEPHDDELLKNVF